MSEFKSIQVLEKDWKTFNIYRLKYGYTNLYVFMSAVAKILIKFKPELDEFRK